MDKVSKVMREYKSGKLHSGSKKGPKVHSKDQALAIALSEAGKSKYTGKKSEYSKTKQGNFMKVHPLDRI